MGNFFEIIFSDTHLNSGGETKVCCPFPHYTSSGEPYYESRPSAGVNMIKEVFHCFACGTGLSETSFIAKYMNLNYGDAKQFKHIIDSAKDTLFNWQSTAVKELYKTPTVLEILKSLHIDEKTAKELNLGFSGKGGIDFPIILFDQLVDVATYRPGSTPKVIRMKGSKSGLIVPYDIWRTSTKPTVICAGEKDMAISRTYGLNAISITGGEGTIPHLLMNDFKNRIVYIAYDNDDAGITGAMRLAIAIKPFVKVIKIIDLSETCTEQGEDLWDYFIKYKQTKDNFKELVKKTLPFSEEDYQKEKEKYFPTIPILHATRADLLGKMVRSNVQISSVFDVQFELPIAFSGKKGPHTASEVKNTVPEGFTKEWYFNENTAKNMFYLIDSGLKETKIIEHRKVLLGMSPKEDNVDMKIEAKETVFKCFVKDILNPDSETEAQEVLTYTIGHKLEHGKKYRLTYKLIPHPMDGQQLVMVVFDVESVNDAITNFKVTPNVMDTLKKFQIKTTLEERIKENIERVKGMIGFDYNNQLITLVDLFFHSVLYFNMGRYKNIKGALDVLLVGETRTGKSTTAEEFIKRYNVGQKIALPTSTIASIIGGSDKVQGAYRTRAGALPLNHGGVVVLEELQKARDPDLIPKLTEIKTSGVARIGRVSGTIELPCVVRMLAITNPKSDGTAIKPISSYPNGIEIVTDLVGAAEDIARFDLIAISSDTADKELVFGQEFLEPYSNIDYQTRINWVWSRKPDQIIITEEIEKYLAHTSNQLNKQFNSHIKIFGTEAWKKIMRLAIAIAGYVVSTDETFEHILIKREHIDFAGEFMKNLYDNPTFKLKEYVEQEKRYRNIDPEGIEMLQQLYNQNPTLIMHLETRSETSRNNMSALSGLQQTDFSKFVSNLVAGLFIELRNSSIYPTERFRKGMVKINRNIKIEKIGRLNPDVKDDVV